MTTPRKTHTRQDRKGKLHNFKDLHTLQFTFLLIYRLQISTTVFTQIATVLASILLNLAVAYSKLNVYCTLVSHDLIIFISSLTQSSNIVFLAAVKPQKIILLFISVNFNSVS